MFTHMFLTGVSAAAVVAMAAVATLGAAERTEPTVFAAETVAAAELETADTSPLPARWAGFERLTGSADVGRRLFESSRTIACNGCHSLTPGEVYVGPSLAGLGSRQSRAQIIESVIRPNAAIVDGFGTHSVLTADGRQLTGRVKRRGADLLIELRSGERVTVAQSDVEAIRPMDSDMPAAAAAPLTAQELADLVAFLESLRDRPLEITTLP